ncbi:MAG TPA: anaerobic ribonucleoside-triphosphate reductase activating protein [Thioploca sp.]|nr:MAG: anaerobic ribonucleoside-triphosphate reductase activating protein [Gammaproteobacteria bacterium]HDN27361.1 anaerobic ribonucleoside-triphosphate reductase activating protein [Thioploca sp.]
MHTTRPTLSIGGLTPFTTIDFPKHLAAVIFCQGCAWRCRYCYNTHLLDSRAKPTLSWDKVDAFLQRRLGLLDAVVFSGGEPTLQKGLLEAVQRVHNLGFKVGLHTAGMNSNMLANVLPYLDWVGFDIKAPFARYATITGVSSSGKQPEKSARLVLESGVAYEFRTTVHPQLLNESDLLKLATSLADLGVQQYVLQDCHTVQRLDSSLQTFSRNDVLGNENLIQAIRALIPQTILR